MRSAFFRSSVTIIHTSSDTCCPNISHIRPKLSRTPISSSLCIRAGIISFLLEPDFFDFCIAVYRLWRTGPWFRSSESAPNKYQHHLSNIRGASTGHQTNKKSTYPNEKSHAKSITIIVKPGAYATNRTSRASETKCCLPKL